jgi:DNA-binding CsgD family transcriptional regulator/sugar-specific transcriptional regulator TrmB
VTGWLGLGADAESVYRILLAEPGDDLADLGDRIGWSAPRFEAALAELADNFLIQWVDRNGRPGFRLANPEIALNSLQLRLESEALERRRQAAASREQVDRLLAEYRRDRLPPRREPYVEEILGAQAVWARVREAADKAERETAAFSPGGVMEPRDPAAGYSYNEVLLRRGVATRIVYLDSVRNDQADLDRLARMTVAGAQIRTVPVLALRMIVFDRSTAFIPIDVEDADAGALVLHGESLVAPLMTLFDLKWAVGAPVGDLPELDGPTPSAQHRAVLLLLFAGHTDEAVARRLGVSLRTARRVIADLMTRLGAHGRFHAGARAAELGWLPISPGTGNAEHGATEG